MIDSYLDALASHRARGSTGGTCSVADPADPAAPAIAAVAPYPRELALRHYRLALCDYGRFVMGRFWGTATPERFAKAAHSPNVVLANRNLESALRFVTRISACLAEFEEEIRAERPVPRP